MHIGKQLRVIIVEPEEVEVSVNEKADHQRELEDASRRDQPLEEMTASRSNLGLQTADG